MTDILIGTHPRNNWQRAGSSATLRIWFSGEFRDTNGVMIDPGNGSSSFYKIVPCTVNPSSHVLTVPAFTLPSTLDGIPVSTLCYGRLYDASNAPRELIINGWTLSNLPTSLPFDSWFIFNQGSSLSSLSNSLQNQMWVTALVDSLLGLASQNFLIETPSGTVDGVNTVFTLSQTPVTNSLQLFQNKQLQQNPVDYTLAGAVITFAVAPLTGDWLIAFFHTAAQLISTPISATQIIETGGPTTLNVGAIPDLTFLQRSGSTVIGNVPVSAALDGTIGTPSATNKFVTNNDTRIAAWNYAGTVIRPSLVADNDNVLEPTVIYEGSPQLLTGNSPVFKMWFSGGWGATLNIYYAESLDGVFWTRRVGAVLANHIRTHVYKSGATYYMTATNATDTAIDLYTSSDGITWTLSTANIVTAAGLGVTLVANTSFFLEGGTWHLLVDNITTAVTEWQVASFTASSPTGPWTLIRLAAIVGPAGGMAGGPSEVHKVNGTYWVWVIGSAAGDGALPTDIYRHRTTDLTAVWTRDPSGPVFSRTTQDEGPTSALSQVADPCVMEIGGRTYLYYSASNDGSAQAGSLHIKLAIANMPVSQLVTTEEGINYASLGWNDINTNIAPAFTAPTLLNSWTNVGAPQATAGYVLHNGVVYLKGAVSGGTVPSANPIFTLPATHRPAALLSFAVTSNGGFGQINVLANGDVLPVVGNTASMTLSNIRFPPNQ